MNGPLLEIFVVVDEELDWRIGNEDSDGVPLVVVVQGRFVGSPFRGDFVSRENIQLKNSSGQGKRDVVELKWLNKLYKMMLQDNSKIVSHNFDTKYPPPHTKNCLFTYNVVP